MTSTQLSEWEAYNRIEPIGNYYRDAQIAALHSFLYNFFSAYTSKKGRHKVSKPEDFIPWYDQSKNIEDIEEQPMEDMKQILYSIAAVSKKKDTN